MKNEIIVIGMLSDEVYIKRQRHCRRVLSTDGIVVCLAAGMGMVGGIVPKIVEIDEEQ